MENPIKMDLGGKPTIFGNVVFLFFFEACPARVPWVTYDNMAKTLRPLLGPEAGTGFQP